MEMRLTFLIINCLQPIAGNGNINDQFINIIKIKESKGNSIDFGE